MREVDPERRQPGRQSKEERPRPHGRRRSLDWRLFCYLGGVAMENLTRMGIALDRATRARLEDLARRSGRSMSAVIRAIIEAADLPPEPPAAVGTWWASSAAGELQAEQV